MPVTDYIAIRGLKTSDTEVFRGIGGGSSGTGDGGGGDTIGLEWGEIPEEAVNMLGTYTDDVNAWLTAMQSYDPNDGSRSITDLAIPAIPALFTALATGGASLPAVATMFVTQAIVNIVGTAVQNYAKSFDNNSLEAIMRKAMLYKDAEGTERSVLDDRLSDLAYVDQVIDFGPFRVHIKGKMIEY
jgi:hypothetical protein